MFQIGHAGPARALVGEVERLVVVDGDDEVVITGGEAELGEFKHRTPLSGGDEEGAVGGDAAYGLDGVSLEEVEPFACEVVFWLVDQLEPEAVRAVGVAFCDGLPAYPRNGVGRHRDPR